MKLAVFAGLLMGLCAATLEWLGNPANMGICVVCFERDIAGALGLHDKAPLQYLRPEIMGIVLGAVACALATGEFRARGGSALLLRFFLGIFATIGALVFMGCTWRMLCRLTGLDLTALVGLAGLVFGVWIAGLLQHRGFAPAAARKIPAAAGWLLPGIMAVLLALAFLSPVIFEGGPIHKSLKGPGALKAPILWALAAGLLIGALAQRTRFCTVGAIRNALFGGRTRLLLAMAAFVVAGLILKLALGKAKPGFAGQFLAHSDVLWNFLGMVLAGLAFTLAGGCPGRQLVLVGEGDTDAAVFVIGGIAGAALCHHLALAAGPDKVLDGALVTGGPGTWGQVAVVAGILFCVASGLLLHRRRAA